MTIRKLPLVLFAIILPLAARGQSLTTSNAFVSAAVQSSTGWIGISSGSQALSFANHSYLSLIIDGKYYTNNNSGPSKATTTIGGTAHVQYPDVSLIGGTSLKRGDTIITDWNEGTFDIQQRVYPVAFRASGQIVLSVRIVNHNTTAMAVSGEQWLLDLRLGSTDAPYVFERYGYDGVRTNIPSVASTSLYLAMQNNLSGTIGAGFTNDSFPPANMGLTRTSGFAVVDWVDASGFTYGIDNSTGSTSLDNAVLMQWPGKSIPGASLNDSTTTELFRTSYGTQEFCMCLGNIVTINIYPTAQKYSFASRTYSPNPLPVLSMVFNSGSSTLNNLYVAHTVASPMHVASGGTISVDGMTGTYSLGTLAPNAMHDFLWTDLTDAGNGGSYPMDFNISTGSTQISSDCGQSGAASGCDVKVDAANTIAIGKPTSQVLSRTGSYDASTCNARMTTIRIHDTGTRRSSISAIAEVAQNMRVLIPSTKQPTDTLDYQVQVIDSMSDGIAVIAVRDTLANVIRDTVRYCTIPDTHTPSYTVTDITKFNKEIALTDTLPWDRGLAKNVSLVGASAVTLTPDPFCPIPSCCSTYRFHVSVNDTVTAATWNVSVIVTDCGNQRLTIPLTFDVPAADVAIDPPSALRIFPNPATDEITIELASEAPQLATIQDLLGRTVARFTVRGSSHFDASKLPEGTYIVRVGSAVKRIVKIR